MPVPISHHLAGGIHPASFVQPTEPDTADLQDGTEWTDTSAGPPYVRRVWSAEASAWRILQMDATGYPLPDGSRLEIISQATASLPEPIEPPGMAAIIAAGSLGGSVEGDPHAAWPAGTYYLAYTDADATGETVASPAAVIALDGTQRPRMSRPAFVGSIPTGYLGSYAYLLGPIPADTGAYAGRLSESYLSSINSWGWDTHSTAMPPLKTVRLLANDGTVDWEHDGVSMHIKSAGVDQIVFPLASLGTAPTLVVGKDPATGLPAFCPAPVTTPRYDGPVPTPTVVADPTADPTLADQQRCGAANRMCSVLTHVYGITQQVVSYVVQQILSWEDHLDVAASLVCGALRMAEAARWIVAASDVLLPKVTELLGVLVVGVLADQFGGISDSEFGTLQEACYCALSAEGGQIAITQATIDSWSAGIEARSGFFLGANANICRILLGLRSLDAWQDDATTGATAPSTDCAGYSCG